MESSAILCLDAKANRDDYLLLNILACTMVPTTTIILGLSLLPYQLLYSRFTGLLVLRNHVCHLDEIEPASMLSMPRLLARVPAQDNPVREGFLQVHGLVLWVVLTIHESGYPGTETKSLSPDLVNVILDVPSASKETTRPFAFLLGHYINEAGMITLSSEAHLLEMCDVALHIPLELVS
jgi:hypothetical protein